MIGREGRRRATVRNPSRLNVEAVHPRGKFFYVTPDADQLNPNPPMHVYAVTADLSFPEVSDSPFDLGIQCWQAAVHPTGKFIFGFHTSELATVQVASTGTLTKTSTVPVSADQPWYVYVHPSGAFLYLQLPQFDHEDIHVYRIDSAGVVTETLSEKYFVTNQSMQFLAFHPSGKFVFARRCDPCHLEILPIDPTTGYINPKPVFSYPDHYPIVLDSTGERAFSVSSGAHIEPECMDTNVHGTLSVFAVSPSGQLHGIATAQTSACPGLPVITQ